MAGVARWPHRSDQPRRTQKRLVELAQGSAETREALAQHLSLIHIFPDKRKDAAIEKQGYQNSECIG